MRSVKEREKFAAFTLKCWKNTLLGKPQTNWLAERPLALSLRGIKRMEEIVRV